MNELDDAAEIDVKVSGKFLPGTLYFMQETDYLTGEKFDYFKIGIVKGERDVFDREKDHKTGNPRQISSVKDIESPAVQILETYLHNTLARHRVSSGEWFYLPGNLINQAIEASQDIRNQLVANIEGLLLEAGKNKSVHFGTPLSHSQTLEELSHEVQRAEALAKSAENLRKRIGEALKEKAGENEDFAHLFKISSIGEKKSFDTNAFSKANKDIYEHYKTKESSTWSLIFLTTPENDLKSDEPTLDGLDPLQLHEAYLEAWSLRESRAFEHALLEAQLINAIGEAAAIDGVAEWKESKRVSFDLPKFRAENPELADQFVKVVPAKVSKSAAEWASYKK